MRRQWMIALVMALGGSQFVQTLRWPCATRDIFPQRSAYQLSLGCRSVAKLQRGSIKAAQPAVRAGSRVPEIVLSLLQVRRLPDTGLSKTSFQYPKISPDIPRPVFQR